MLFREGVESELNESFQFRVEQMNGRAGAVGVRSFERRRVGWGKLGGLQGVSGVSVTSAQFIQAEVPGDGEEPGGKAGVFTVATGETEDLNEGCLGQVFSLSGVVQHPVEKVEYGLAVFVDEGREGVAIAAFYAAHEGDIGVIGWHGHGIDIVAAPVVGR